MKLNFVLKDRVTRVFDVPDGTHVDMSDWVCIRRPDDTYHAAFNPGEILYWYATESDDEAPEATTEE
ncbi:MAG: hypothetical protein KGL39_47535 [Patescibacteria group bacterium]|nr:hypothetical protein [Patescibacteria group bacterium]